MGRKKTIDRENKAKARKSYRREKGEIKLKGKRQKIKCREKGRQMRRERERKWQKGG